MPIEELREYRP